MKDPEQAAQKNASRLDPREFLVRSALGVGADQVTGDHVFGSPVGIS